MLIRNATAFVGGCFCAGMEVRVHNGHIHEVGQGLAKGLYEDAIDLDGDFLLPGFVETHIHGYQGHDTMQGEAAVRAMCRGLFRAGVCAFRLVVASDYGFAAECVRRVMENPEHHGAVVLGVCAGDEAPVSPLMAQQAFQNLLAWGVAPEEAVLMCTATPADSVGEKLAGRIVAGAPAPLTRWSGEWTYKGILA